LLVRELLKVILSVEKLSKDYSGKVALDDVNFVLSGGVYGLLGPNGSGKTTLMSILTGNLKATSGQVRWDGRDILKLGTDYRKILGYVPQQSALYPEFTASRYLFYMATLHGMSRQDARDRVPEVLAHVNLSDVSTKKIKTLSGGMKQRLLIAQSILHDPRLLVMDEPTAGLDPYQRAFMVSLIKDIAKDRTVLISTHIVSDIEYMAAEVLLLKEGVLLRKDTPDAIIAELADIPISDGRPLHRQLTLEDVYIHFFGDSYVEDSLL
jgi:ABC-type multidrug transport system ATPase subunit